jgi:hypothetical protein
MCRPWWTQIPWCFPLGWAAPGLSFSPPCAEKGAVHTNVFPLQLSQPLPSACVVADLILQPEVEDLPSPLGYPCEEAPAETRHQEICQTREGTS